MWTDNETDIDLLGYTVHKDLIKSVVLDESILPVSIGVFGDWGSGKSSIMKMLSKDFEGKEDIACVYFNGWVFEGYDDAKAALIEGILESLKENTTFGNTIIGEITELKKKVNWLRAGGFFVKNIAIPAAMAYATGGVSLLSTASSWFEKIKAEGADILNSEGGEKMLAELSGVVKKDEEEQVSTVVREFRSDFEKLIEKTNLKSLVILIDDLDRCSPDRIIDNLEAIKLFLNVPKTAFVIGADERIVRHAIEYRYKDISSAYNSKEIKDYDGLITDYLEKLIQIPYRIPKLSNNDVEAYMTLLLAQKELPNKFTDILTDFEDFRDKDKHSCYSISNIEKIIPNHPDIDKVKLANRIAPLVCRGLKGNPRQIKRFLNSFVLRGKLADAAKFVLNPEILTKLMVLEYMRLSRFEELFLMQQKQDGKPQEIELLEKQAKSGVIEGELSVWNEPDVIKWLLMEPSLVGVELMNYFWIARDKLKETMDTSAMLPNIVIELFNRMKSPSGEQNLRNTITSEVALLDSNNVDLLYNYVTKKIIETPSEIFLWDILQISVILNNEAAKRYYITLFDAVQWKDVNLGVSVHMKAIFKQYPEMTTHKSSITNTRITKAVFDIKPTTSYLK